MDHNPSEIFVLDHLAVPWHQIPNARIQEAVDRGAKDNWLFYCWGGLGDRVCSEPTLRWAKKYLRKNRMMILTEEPEIFAHLEGGGVEVKKIGVPNSIDPKQWYMTMTIQPPNEVGAMLWQFYSHMLVHAVDYVSMTCLRMMLPNDHKEIRLSHGEVSDRVRGIGGCVVVHPGRHWPSKTFPASWWQQVCKEIVGVGLRPILIGTKVDENVGFVEFKAPKGCWDWRNKLTLNDMVYVLKRSACLISNDSAAIHIAAAGDAWIGCLATVKHPDYITHWRRGRFGWRFRNLANDGLYSRYDISPFTTYAISCEEIDPEFLSKCLPDPSDVAAFARQSIDDYHH